MDHDRKQGIIFSLLASFCGACVPIFSKLILQTYSPALTLLVRMVVSLILLYILVKVVIRINISITKETLRIAFFGAANFALFIFAIRYIPAHIGPIFYCLVPLESTILLFFFHREKISFMKLAGIIIGYVGALIVVLPSLGEKGKDSIALLGVVLILAASVCTALYSVLIQKSKVPYSPYNLSFQAIMLAGMFSVPLVFVTGDLTTGKKFHPTIILLFLGLAIIATIGQYVLFQKGIEKIQASANVVMFYFQPPFALAMSMLILNEKVKATFFLGFLVVLCGSTLNLYSRRDHLDEEPMELT